MCTFNPFVHIITSSRKIQPRKPFYEARYALPLSKGYTCAVVWEGCAYQATADEARDLESWVNWWNARDRIEHTIFVDMVDKGGFFYCVNA